jgi:hypothetical protein
MYSLRQDASAVNLVKYRLSASKSASLVVACGSSSTACGPGKKREKAILQAWGVVTSAWNRRDTKVIADKDCGGRWERMWVRTSADEGQQVTALRGGKEPTIGKCLKRTLRLSSGSHYPECKVILLHRGSPGSPSILILTHSIDLGRGRATVNIHGRVLFTLNRHARDVCRVSGLLSLEKVRDLSVIEVMSMLGGTGIDLG